MKARLALLALAFCSGIAWAQYDFDQLQRGGSRKKTQELTAEEAAPARKHTPVPEKARPARPAPALPESPQNEAPPLPAPMVESSQNVTSPPDLTPPTQEYAAPAAAPAYPQPTPLEPDTSSWDWEELFDWLGDEETLGLGALGLLGILLLFIAIMTVKRSLNSLAWRWLVLGEALVIAGTIVAFTYDEDTDLLGMAVIGGIALAALLLVNGILLVARVFVPGQAEKEVPIAAPTSTAAALHSPPSSPRPDPSATFSSADALIAAHLEPDERQLHLCAGNIEIVSGHQLSLKNLLLLLATRSLVRAIGELRRKNDSTATRALLIKLGVAIAALAGTWFFFREIRLLLLVGLILFGVFAMFKDVVEWIRRKSDVPDLLVITDRNYLILQGVVHDRVAGSYTCAESIKVPREQVQKAGWLKTLLWEYGLSLHFPPGDPNHFELPAFAYRVPLLSSLTRKLNTSTLRLNQAALPTIRHHLDSPHLSSARFLRRNLSPDAVAAAPAKLRLQGFPGRFSLRRIPRQAVFALLILSVAIGGTVEFFQDQGNLEAFASSELTNLNADNARQRLTPVELNDRYGYFDTATTRVVIQPEFDEAGFFGPNGLAPVRVVGAYGYIDINGHYAIPPQFRHGGQFGPNGLAPASKDDLFGYIDSSGQWVIPPRFAAAGEFGKNALAPVKSGSKYGYIDSTGQFVIKPMFADAGNFGENGLAPVKAAASGKWGYIDMEGRFSIPAMYSHASEFTFVARGNPLGYFAVVHFPDDSQGVIDGENKVMARVHHQFVDALHENGLARFTDESGRYGYMDVLGNAVIPASYRYAENFSPTGLARVSSDESQDFDLIDASGLSHMVKRDPRCGTQVLYPAMASSSSWPTDYQERCSRYQEREQKLRAAGVGYIAELISLERRIPEIASFLAAAEAAGPGQNLGDAAKKLIRDGTAQDHHWESLGQYGTSAISLDSAVAELSQAGQVIRMAWVKEVRAEGDASKEAFYVNCSAGGLKAYTADLMLKYSNAELTGGPRASQWLGFNGNAAPNTYPEAVWQRLCGSGRIAG